MYPDIAIIVVFIVFVALRLLILYGLIGSIKSKYAEQVTDAGPERDIATTTVLLVVAIGSILMKFEATSMSEELNRTNINLKQAVEYPHANGYCPILIELVVLSLHKEVQFAQILGIF